MNRIVSNSIQKHKFEEERVRRILIYAMPEKYSNSKLSESPDIIVSNLSIGVEVTDCMLPSIQEKFSYILRIASGKIKPNRKQIERNRDIQIHPTPIGEDLVSFHVWGNTSNLLGVYVKKLKKLNKSHFNTFQENNLFVTAWLIDEDELNNDLRAIINLKTLDKEPLDIYFDNLYICTGKDLIMVSFAANSITKQKIPIEVLDKINEEAFTKIVGKNRNQYYNQIKNKRNNKEI